METREETGGLSLEELSKTLHFFTSPTKLQILSLLWEYEDGLTRKELRKLIKRHISTIDHAICDLKRLGVIRKEGKLSRYVLTENGRRVFFAIKYIKECVDNAKSKKGKMGKSSKKYEKRKSRKAS